MNPRESWIAFQTLLFKETKRVFRIWSQTLLAPAMTTTLYFLIFGHVIGRRIGQVNGYHYIDFIAPGLIIFTMMTSAYNGAVGAVFLARFSRSIEELLVSPMSNFSILLAYVASGVTRGVIVGVIVTIIALLFTHIGVHSIFIVLFVALVATTVFATGGVINAIFAKNWDDISVIPTFVLTPLIYLGGVFYSVKMLPKFWYYVSLGNPVVYIVEAFRYGFLGTNAAHLYIACSALVLLMFVFFYFAYYLLAKGVGVRS